MTKSMPETDPQKRDRQDNTRTAPDPDGDRSKDRSVESPDAPEADGPGRIQPRGDEPTNH